ncbi:MAG: helix-turn-helix domain-containing protein [Christensenellales bacterium]
MNLKELVNRLGYFRNKRNLSSREVSLRMGYSETWYYRVEAGQIDINVSTLFGLCEVLEIQPSDLFYYDINKIEEDKELNNLIPKLTSLEKESICNLIKRK